MKKQKTTRPFWFKDMTHKQMVDKLNEEHPINLRYNEDIVNRVHLRYPILNKSSISIIIKTVFQSFRDLIIMGNILNFHKLFFDTKILVFKYVKNDVISPALKVRISTPPELKKYGSTE